MNTTRTRTRGTFRFPKVDSIVSGWMLAVGFASVLLVLGTAFGALGV